MNTAHVSSFVLISILSGQPRTPPSGDNLGVLDYHLNGRSCIAWKRWAQVSGSLENREKMNRKPVLS